MGPLGFWTWSLFINIFTEEKYQKRQRETTTCLFPLQSVLVSRSHNDWHRCQSPHLSVCLISWCINLSIFVLLAGEYAGKQKKNTISHHLTGNPDHSQERINHFLDLAPSDCSGRRSWQLIASGLSVILPPSSESWLVQEQESAVRLCNWERQISKNQRTVCASPCLVFWFFTVCQVQLYCV